MLEVYQKFSFGTGFSVFFIVLHLPTTVFLKLSLQKTPAREDRALAVIHKCAIIPVVRQKQETETDLSCISFHAASLAGNSVEALCAGTAAQDKVGGRIVCIDRKLSGLVFKQKKRLKQCLEILQIHVLTCCGYLQYPCLEAYVQGDFFHK